MEKLSLYDFFSVLLPGAIFTLCIHIILTDLQFDINFDHWGDYYALTVYLTASFFFGSMINITTKRINGLYEKIRMHTRIYNVFIASKMLKDLKPYYYKLAKVKNKEALTDKHVELLWSEMYYELEAQDKNSLPKTNQSFYFFFRNMFTMGFILLPFLLLLNILHIGYINYFLFAVCVLFFMLLSYLAAKSYRKRMVEAMFWIYYSLHKNK